MEEVLLECEEKMLKAIENMEKRFTNVRAGRANPRILDGVMVKYYGVETPLIQLATISVPEARMLVIKPFDKSCISDIEKGIYEANIAFSIPLKQLLSNGLINNCLASGTEIVASCFKGVKLP